MKKKRKPEIAATLQAKIDSRINAMRNRMRGCDRDKDTLKTLRSMQWVGRIILAVGSVIFITIFYRRFAAGNPPLIKEWFFVLFYITFCVGFIILIKKFFLVNPEGRVRQGNAISKNFRIARVSRGSFLRYSIGEKKSKLWKHNPIVIALGTTVFFCMGLVYCFAGYRTITNPQNVIVFFGAIFSFLLGIFLLVLSVLVLRYKLQELKPDIEYLKRIRSLPKTVVETERMPILIGEENRFFIRQYGKNTDEFFGCSAEISLVLEETEEYYGQKGYSELTETRQRAKRLVHEHWFDHETESRRYEFSFTAVLPAEDYAPTTHAHFLSARLAYEWYLRVEIFSKSGTLLSRDFPVLLSCATEGA